MKWISTSQYDQRQNRFWQTTRQMTISILLTTLAFISGEAYAIQTFTLGNYVPPSDLSGPSGNGNKVLTYPGGRTVYFSQTPELAPANVIINWNGSHGSSSSETDSLFCTQSDQGSGNGSLSVESGLITAGSYGGVAIFKTNITGLYFSLALRSFSSYALIVTAPTLQIRDGVMKNVISVQDNGHLCSQTNETGDINYKSMGTLGFYAAITFYTDQTYTPGTSTISLLKSGDYHVRIWNENPGAGITGYYQNVTFDISAVTVAEPTCTTQPVASGNSVSGSTVNLGSYSPNDIINGATAVPFAINLGGCKGLRNINVTLASTNVATDATLLGNILTLNHATGVGLEIRGAANNYSTETLIIPNESTSVYNDQRDTASDDNIYGSSENGKVQTHTLNFLATLKRDSNQKIGSGNFKANGIFTLDYP